MQRNDTKPRSRSLIIALALSGTLALGGLPAVAQPTVARADTPMGAEQGTATDTNATPDEAQRKVEQSAAAYNEAMAKVDELNDQIADNEQKIDQLEADLPAQQERGAVAYRALYKMQQESPGLLDLILDAESLGDFLNTLEYITHIQNNNLAEIDRLKSMQSELDSTRLQLSTAKKSANDEADAAQQALAEAQAAREEAQRKAEEQARAEAEAAAKAQAEAAAKEQAAAAAGANGGEAARSTAGGEASGSDTGETDNGSTGGGEAVAPSEPVNPAPPSDGADWSSDKSSFVAQWAGRIDAYLAGSPMAGTGTIFAEAAWDYGVDPRWSPAISNTESSKGLYCFKPHNAWGWGSNGFSSWDEAIRTHVAGLARGYGYTISIAAAQKYCPPNWEHWYNATSAQMELI